VSKFDLRDISERLESSRDTEAVVSEFIGYLQALHTDWHVALAFYEVSSDSLVSVCERQGSRLVRRNVALPVDRLPARLVRKFFHPSAFFNQIKSRPVLGNWFRSSPSYEPDPVDAPALKPLLPDTDWMSCVCLPIADHDDILALLMITSPKRGAFTSKAIGEIIPVKSIASLALAHHLHRAAWNQDDPTGLASAEPGEFRERIKRLDQQARELEQDNREKARKLTELAGEVEHLDKSSSEYKLELERVKGTIMALEEQSVAATQHLSDAYVELTVTQARLAETERTIGFMKDVFQVLSQEHIPDELPRTLVSWFCRQFGIERCSLMMLDGSGETLHMGAQCGIDPAVASRVKVRVGQGIAGWVAHNRKPLFVRVRDEVPPMPRTVKETYNSDSFICVPLVYNNRLYGVMSLSNKRDGEPFEAVDLDRAVLASSVVAVMLGGQEMSRRAAVWA
jgi:transcriptional regulator with GAF, ATPase, and Fis domain